MQPCMNFQSTCSRITFITTPKLACKRFLACMRKLMRLKMTFSNELVFANWTSKWSLTGVSPHMGF